MAHRTRVNTCTALNIAGLSEKRSWLTSMIDPVRSLRYEGLDTSVVMHRRLRNDFCPCSLSLVESCLAVMQAGSRCAPARFIPSTFWESAK